MNTLQQNVEKQLAFDEQLKEANQYLGDHIIRRCSFVRSGGDLNVLSESMRCDNIMRRISLIYRENQEEEKKICEERQRSALMEFNKFQLKNVPTNNGLLKRSITQSSLQNNTSNYPHGTGQQKACLNDMEVIPPPKVARNSNTTRANVLFHNKLLFSQPPGKSLPSNKIDGKLNANKITSNNKISSSIKPISSASNKQELPLFVDNNCHNNIQSLNSSCITIQTNNIPPPPPLPHFVNTHNENSNSSNFIVQNQVQSNDCDKNKDTQKDPNKIKRDTKKLKKSLSTIIVDRNTSRQSSNAQPQKWHSGSIHRNMLTSANKRIQN